MFSDRKRKPNRWLAKEDGAVMLEGVVVMVFTTIMLIWVLSLGFVYYQRYTTTVVTNDAAVKVASTYCNPTSDIIMGFVTTEDLSERDVYRGFTSETFALRRANENRAEAYVKYRLDKTNLNGAIQRVDVKLELVKDSLLRKHVKVTTTCTYNTPFGFALDFLGMDGTLTYTSTACADCTDYADYISTVGFINSLGTGSYLGSEKFFQGFVKMVNSIIKAVNHFTS